MAIVEVQQDEFDWESATGPAAELQRIARAATSHDGVFTLNEQAVLGLSHRGLENARLWIGDGGFALLRDGSMLELAVHPESRRRGVATALMEHVSGATETVEAWSHADHPGAAALASRFGVPRVRELLVMRRSTELPLAAVEVPDDITIRTFQPGDEGALIDVNAAAFAHHPEQGSMSVADFRERMNSDWWDPNGLFLAVPRDPDSAPAVLGFHWTKVHREDGEPYGEVYVVAVNPRMAGRGLGTLLTNVGLSHLQDMGLGSVLLYVEGDNAPAIAVYTKQGFTVERTEAQYVGRIHSDR
jgi:mycothiol synthase